MFEEKKKIKKRIISLYPKEEYEKPQYFEKTEKPIDGKENRKDKENNIAG